MINLWIKKKKKRLIWLIIITHLRGGGLLDPHLKQSLAEEKETMATIGSALT